MYSDLTFKLLWFAHPILQLIVVGVMYQRKLHRKFPVFFTYLLLQIFNFVLIYSAYTHMTEQKDYARYFYLYWGCAAISLVVGFKIIHEIFLDVFRPYHALKDLGSVLFKWAALVMILVAIVVAASNAASEDGPIVESVLMVQRCVRVIQVGLILFLIVFSKYVGVDWKQYSFGVCLGFGWFAIVELLAVALHASTHLSEDTAGRANMVAYNLSILVWLVYSLKKIPMREMTSMLLTSQRWNHSLADLQHPGTPDSLIPMFENMVDRAFSRTGPNHELPKVTDTPLTTSAPAKADTASVPEAPKALGTTSS